MPQETRQELLKTIEVLKHENNLLRQEKNHYAPSENYTQEILDSIPAPIYLKDAEGRYILINRRYEELAQVTLADIVGKNDFDIFPQPVAALFRSQDEEVMQKNAPVEFEETVPLADGFHTFITSKFTLHEKDGSVAAVGGFCTDITERKEIETKQRQLQLEIQEFKHRIEKEKIKNRALAQSRLASLGQLATGVAHEINQPLTFIKVMFQSFLKDYENNQIFSNEAAEDCTEALNQVFRISTLIEQLRFMGRGSSNAFERVNFNDVVGNALILLRQQMKTNGIKLSLYIQENLPLVKGNLIDLERVIINLLQNSIDALDSPKKKKEISLSINTENEQVKILLMDNGQGIDESIEDRIFEPFFSTKEVGEGTGIGLSIVHGIIQDHGGEIQNMPQEEGSCFQITLPYICI